ncbi:glycosyltransferase [Marimonas sp. MJW-29]|uniref:Glycosyltransferase n=1 Tax=Sulfitobacter sediminis TaxID=3234186 RepID=A0ABV3RHX8_9RHOB
MTKRHILVANVFFAPFSYGGATVVAEQVAQALIRQGAFRVTAVSLCARSDLAPYVVMKSQQNGIENYLINVPAGRGYGAMYDNPEVTARLAELIHALEPDLIHAHCIQEIGTGLISAAEAAQVPVILSVHDFWWLCERQFMIRMDETYCGQSPVRIEGCKGCAENFWAAKMRFNHLQDMSRKVAAVTYPSAFSRNLSEASGFAPGLGVVWENGVRPPGEAFFVRQRDRRRRDGRLTFGYLGGPSQIKGWPQIKRAFKGLSRQDFRGIVVEGSLDGSWWRESDLAGLSGDWCIHPRFNQSTMDAFYAEIDVLLFMSQWKETFGLAIREAIARGIAVIQTDSGGTVEHPAVVPEKLIPIGASSEGLRQAIETQLSDYTRVRPPHAVSSFDDQARAFTAIANRVLLAFARAA